MILWHRIGAFKMKYKESIVYRVIPSADGGYSLSAEFNGNVEITSYDSEGKPTTRTYGKTTKRKYKRFKIQICPIKEMYLIAKHINLDNAAVIMCSSYHIDDEKVCGIKNKLCLEFDDTTIIRSPRAFNIDIAKRIRTFIDSLGKEITVLYICCNSGESRSTALSAAIMRYVKMSDKDIWENPYYHPNPLVYKLQCKAFGIFVSKLGTQKRVRMNEKALRRKMNSSNKRK